MSINSKINWGNVLNGGISIEKINFEIGEQAPYPTYDQYGTCRTNVNGVMGQKIPEGFVNLVESVQLAPNHYTPLRNSIDEVIREHPEWYQLRSTLMSLGNQVDKLFTDNNNLQDLINGLEISVAELKDELVVVKSDPMYFLRETVKNFSLLN